MLSKFINFLIRSHKNPQLGNPHIQRDANPSKNTNRNEIHKQIQNRFKKKGNGAKIHLVGEHGGMSTATPDILLVELLIKRDGFAEALHRIGDALLEPSAPKLVLLFPLLLVLHLEFRRHGIRRWGPAPPLPRAGVDAPAVPRERAKKLVVRRG